MKSPFDGMTQKQAYELRMNCDICRQEANVVFNLSKPSQKPYFRCEKCNRNWEMSDYILDYFIKEVLR